MVSGSEPNAFDFGRYQIWLFSWTKTHVRLQATVKTLKPGETYASEGKGSQQKVFDWPEHGENHGFGIGTERVRFW